MPNIRSNLTPEELAKRLDALKDYQNMYTEKKRASTRSYVRGPYRTKRIIKKEEEAKAAEALRIENERLH